MARIVVADAQAWVEASKLPISALDAAMLDQLEAQILGALSGAFDTTAWVSPATTPPLVKSVIAMRYASWYYNKVYSEDQEALNDYALWLFGQANDLMSGILNGAIVLPDVPLPSTDGPSFYPNDNSSAMEPTALDRSLGDAKFSTGMVF